MPNLGLAKVEAALRDGRTVVTQQLGQAPLQVHAPLYLDGSDYPTVYIKTPCSGLLDGDEHRINIVVQPNAVLEIRTQASTLVYPGAASQQINISVGENAQLVFLPHPLILGAGANFSQRINIECSESSKLRFSEQWCAGRIAMGEKWRFERFANRVELRQNQKLIFRENYAIAPSTQPLNHQFICGNYTHFGSFYQAGMPDLEIKDDDAGARFWSIARHGITITKYGAHTWRNCG